MAADLTSSLLPPQPAAVVAQRAVEHAGALAEQMEMSSLTLAFTSPPLERAYAAYRATVSARPLRAGVVALACAYLPLEASLEAWQLRQRHAIAGYAWAFALVAAAVLVSAFLASNMQTARADLVGGCVLTGLAWSVVGRAAFARVDPLAPPVALALLFFIGAGPSLVRIRFGAMFCVLALVGGAHALAVACHPSSARYAVWYEVGVVAIGVMSALSCRRLEQDHRREFFLLACISVERGALPPGGALALASADATAAAPAGRPRSIDEALRELRELGHRLHVRLPSARVRTDAMERALDESGASSLAELLIRHARHSHGNSSQSRSRPGSPGPRTASPPPRHRRMPSAPASIVRGAVRGARATSPLARGLVRGAVTLATDAGGYVPPTPTVPGRTRTAQTLSTASSPDVPAQAQGGPSYSAPAADARAGAEAARACAPASDAAGRCGAPEAAAVVLTMGGAGEDGGPYLLRGQEELPAYFAPYTYVLSGYRCELTTLQCLRSVFQWHNETLNVWSELLPAAAFAWTTRAFLRSPSVATLTAQDRVLLTVGLLVALVVRPLCSAAAHLLYCGMDSAVYALWWSVDYVSICAAILCVSLVSARNSFYCEPELEHLFFVCSSGLLCTSLIAVLCTASSSVRAFSFLLFVVFCNLVPFGYQLASKLAGWYHNDAPWPYLHFWVASLGTFALGLVIKSACVPEAFRPGRFDYVGASHQLWHVCINVAFVLGTLVPWRIYADWRADVPCPPSGPLVPTGPLGSYGWR